MLLGILSVSRKIKNIVHTNKFLGETEKRKEGAREEGGEDGRGDIEREKAPLR